MRSLRRLLAPALGVALLAGGWASSASAQEDEQDSADRLVLRMVDARDPDAVEVAVSWSGDAGALASMEVEENGEAVAATVASLPDAGLLHDVMFVVDTSASTDTNAMLTTTKQVLDAYVQALPPGTRAGVVTAGAAAQVLQGLTTDVARLREGVGDLTPSGDGGVYAGILQAAGRIDAAGNIGTVVLFTDGIRDESTSASFAAGGLTEAGAVLHVIGLEEDGFDAGAFSGLAEDSGGTMQVVSEAGDIPGAFAEVQPELAQLAVGTFASPEGVGVQEIVVDVADTAVEGSYVSGGLHLGPQRLQPRPAVEPSGPSFLRSDLGRQLGFLGILLAAILFVFGIVSIVVREDTGLDRILKDATGATFGSDGDADEAQQNLAQTAFLKRAVEATESFAERQGFLDRIERTLERADVPLRAGEAMFFYLALGFLLLGLAFALTANPLGAFVIGLIGFLVPPAVLSFRANRKQRQFEALLPDTLQLLSSTLRAGYSMMQGVEAVSQEAAEPMGKELRRVVTEARLGRPLEEALEGVAERMESEDFAWAVMAIGIQREVGGNLAELLLTVGETMTQRERLRRDVKSLTAEGRMSAYVLGGLPIGLGIVLYMMNPEYIGRLFETGLGQVMLGISIVAMAAGFAWMFKIIKIEI
jgi:tight adherence protein B